MNELSDSELIHCQHAFQLFDMDADGFLVPEEYKELMGGLRLNPTDEEIEETYNYYRAIKDMDAIDSLDLVAEVNVYLSGTRDEDKLREAFAIFDHEKTGFVLASEIKFMLMNFCNELTEDEVSELFRYVNINNDGEIFYEEFLDVFRPLEYDVDNDSFSDIESYSEDKTPFECTQ